MEVPKLGDLGAIPQLWGSKIDGSPQTWGFRGVIQVPILEQGIYNS